MNAEECSEIAEALRRSLLLVHTGQMSEMAGCRIEGAVTALRSIPGDPSSPYAEAHIGETIRRLTAIQDEGEITTATAYRREGALLALQSVSGDAASLLAKLIPCSNRSPTGPQMPNNPGAPRTADIRLTHLGQPPTMQVQL